MDIISVTPAAVARLKELMAAQETAPEAVLLSVTSKGCSGLKYDMQFLPQKDKAPAGADCVAAEGLTIYVDPMAAIYLVGTVMDYKEDALRSGFDFLNPNETGRCGCGESFSVASK